MLHNGVDSPCPAAYVVSSIPSDLTLCLKSSCCLRLSSRAVPFFAPELRASCRVAAPATFTDTNASDVRTAVHALARARRVVGEEEPRLHAARPAVKTTDRLEHPSAQPDGRDRRLLAHLRIDAPRQQDGANPKPKPDPDPSPSPSPSPDPSPSPSPSPSPHPSPSLSPSLTLTLTLTRCSARCRCRRLSPCCSSPYRPPSSCSSRRASPSP